MSENILIITSSGGGGLLQSAIASEQEERKKDPEVKIIKKDLLRDWGGPLGVLGVHMYNWTQRSGSVFLTNILVACNMAAERVFYPLVMIYLLSTLFKNKIDRVIDNQVMNTSCLIKAIRIYNRMAGKKILLEKVLVDLPTKKYRKILKSIKSLSRKDKKFIRIFTIEPLLEEENSYEEFWQKYCAISEKQIVYKKYIIRESFKKLQGHPKPAGNFDFGIAFSSEKEKDIMGKCFEKGSIVKKNEEKKNFLSFTIKPEDKLFVILLGSNPSSSAVYNYVKGIIDRVGDFSKKDELYHLFVFADKFSDKKESLFYQIYNLISSYENYPENLSIIPMSFQKDDVIAPLFYRSDLTITRSGGHTIMELMAVSSGMKWIHSETRKNHSQEVLSFEKLLKGIPCWELGNAQYLHEKFGGDVVTPETIYDKLAVIIQ